MTAMVLALALVASPAVPTFDALLRQDVRLKPELVGVHPRVFVTKAELETLRTRARTTHRGEWTRVLAGLAATKGDAPPPPGPQERRSQNNVAFAIAEVSLAYAIERKPEYLAAARRWTLAAIDYEPWGYTYNKPNVDLAAGHLLYAIGWAYDLLYAEWTPSERERIRASLARHARVVHDFFAPGPGKLLNFTQNHDFIPTAGLAVAALALMGEVEDAPRWAALARAHHHRAGLLLSPDGYYYEGFEYWIFSAPWLVHFLDAWEHATGESLWELGPYRNWKHYLAHALLPDGRSVFDFGDIWEGALTRAQAGQDYARVYPGGTLQSNANVMYRVAARLRDPEAQAVAARYASFGHSSLEEYWTLLWRDPQLAGAPVDALPLRHHFEDSGVVSFRTSWGADATALAFKAGPPEGHRVTRLLPQVPEWGLSSGHAHPDAGSFIVWARGRYLVGDTGYAGLPSARDHNTLTFGGAGQGIEGEHDVWARLPYERLDGIRITEARLAERGVRVVAELAPAYPGSLGLTRATRTFTFDGDRTIRVRDEVEASQPLPVEWRLHADQPFDGTEARYVVDAGGVRLEVELSDAEGARAATGPSFLTTPGRPGSIEQGAREQRGHELVWSRAAATRHCFDVLLRLR
jgi:hypothetical protein